MSALAFICQETNDLYRVAVNSGFQVTRYSSFSHAMAAIKPGTGILVLADQYPIKGEDLSLVVLEEAVQKAYNFASPGDCVLLSPMCSSFDMFTSYEERGRVFKEIVGRLP